MKRSEVDNKYKWNLGDIFASNEDWEQDFNKMQSILPTLKELKDGFTDSAQNLADALSRIDEASLLCERLFVYAKMRRDEDNANAQYQAMTDRAMSLYVAVSGESSFVAPALLAQPEEKLENYMAEEERLAPYAFMIRDTIRQKTARAGRERGKDSLDERGFCIAARATYSRCSTTWTCTFGSVQTEGGRRLRLTHAKFIELMQNQRPPDKRKDAFETYYSAFRGSINTIAAAYCDKRQKGCFLCARTQL